MNCGRYFSDEERLACYDAVYSARIRGVKPPPGEPEGSPYGSTYASPGQAPAAAASTTAVPGAASTAEDEFGYPTFGDSSDIDLLVSPIVKVEENSRNRLVFYLENGQVWVQDEGKRFYVPEGPQVAEIKPGFLSSYHLNLQGGKSWIKVERVR